MASTRFPGKPLELINGTPMLGHCYYRTKLSQKLSEVYIATCDQEIKEFCENIGAKCIMTSGDHERASDRVAEAMLEIEKVDQKISEIVVLVQGDEPMIQPSMIDLAIEPLENDASVKVSNGYAKIGTLEEFNDPNEVKVVIDENSDAIYFSREPIPSLKKWDSEVVMHKQVCVIPFRRDYLLEFNKLSQTPLEKIESIDMLRVIEHGQKVRMVEMNYNTFSVDTAEDLEKVKKLMRGDKLIEKYYIAE